MSKRQTITTRGARLSAAIGQAGITQAELARRLGITEQRIHNIVAGRCNVTLDWLHSAAGAIGCSGSSLDPALSDAIPVAAKDDAK